MLGWPRRRRRARLRRKRRRRRCPLGLTCEAGAVGSAARYLVSLRALRLFGPGFPYGTLTVNVQAIPWRRTGSRQPLSSLSSRITADATAVYSPPPLSTRAPFPPRRPAATGQPMQDEHDDRHRNDPDSGVHRLLLAGAARSRWPVGSRRGGSGRSRLRQGRSHDPQPPRRRIPGNQVAHAGHPSKSAAIRSRS